MTATITDIVVEKALGIGRGEFSFTGSSPPIRCYPEFESMRIIVSSITGDATLTIRATGSEESKVIDETAIWFDINGYSALKVIATLDLVQLRPTAFRIVSDVATATYVVNAYYKR